MDQIAPPPLELTPPPMPEERRRTPRDPAAPFLGALIGSLILVCCAVLFLLITSNWGREKDQTALLPEESDGAHRHAIDDWAAAPLPQPEAEAVAQEPAAAPDSSDAPSHPDRIAEGAEPSIAPPQSGPARAPADATASVMPAAPAADAAQQMDAKSLEAAGPDLDDTAPAPDRALGAGEPPAEKVAAEHGTTPDSAGATEAAPAPAAAAAASEDASAVSKDASTPKDASAPKKMARNDSLEPASRPAKPRWKPMTVGTPAASGGSYDQKVWAALAHHRPHVEQGGSAVVSFAVGPAGGLRGVRISRSSGNSRLDQMAVAAVRGAAPFPAPPLGSGTRTYSIQIFFR
jgi:protein TonB